MKYKVGDKVFVKYDIEQPGIIVKIDRSAYYVRVFQGEYVQDRREGVVVPFSASEIWTE